MSLKLFPDENKNVVVKELVVLICDSNIPLLLFVSFSSACPLGCQTCVANSDGSASECTVCKSGHALAADKTCQGEDFTSHNNITRI